MPVPRYVETERLRLRQFRDDDLDRLARLNANPEFTRYIGPTMSRADSWRQLAMLLGHWHLRGYGWWAVELKSEAGLIGRIGLFWPEGWPGLEVGWALAPSVWGRGLATEGGAAALALARTHLPDEAPLSVIFPANAASIRVAEKLGGRYERRWQLRDQEVAIYRYHRRPD